MNTKTASAKCHCRNCDGHIEFDPSAAGQTATCPHCGMDTTLFIPGITTLAPGAPPWYRQRTVLRIIFGLIGATLLVVFMVLFANSGAAQKMAINTGVGLIGLSLALITAIMVILTIVLWIFFPVFMYFGLGRVEKLLQQIERNTRQ